MTDPTLHPYRVTVTATIKAASKPDSIAQVQRCIKRLGGTFVGGGSAEVREEK